MKSLAKNVGDRYPSAAAMKADIDRYLAGQPVQAPAVQPWPPPPACMPAGHPDARSPTRCADADDEEPERKRRGPLILLLLLLLALIAAALDLRAQAVRGRARAAVGADHHRAHPRPGRAAPSATAGSRSAR